MARSTSSVGASRVGAPLSPKLRSPCLLPGAGPRPRLPLLPASRWTSPGAPRGRWPQSTRATAGALRAVRGEADMASATFCSTSILTAIIGLCISASTALTSALVALCPRLSFSHLVNGRPPEDLTFSLSSDPSEPPNIDNCSFTRILASAQHSSLPGTPRPTPASGAPPLHDPAAFFRDSCADLTALFVLGVGLGTGLW
mmetsp:Transcript_19026/g.36326  ORF Transcript_19026/g.36326 Transcript_19026/m.36326 type:complete len:200 (-) Transcript_19026:47-646(-)